MGFTLSFKNGPRDGQNEDRRSAPETLPQPDAVEPGVYRLDRISGTTAIMVWCPHGDGKAGQ